MAHARSVAPFLHFQCGSQTASGNKYERVCGIILCSLSMHSNGGKVLILNWIERQKNIFTLQKKLLVRVWSWGFNFTCISLTYTSEEIFL